MNLIDLIAEYSKEFYPNDNYANFKLWQLIEKGQYSFSKFKTEEMSRDIVTELIRASDNRTQWVFLGSLIPIAEWKLLYNNWLTKQ